MPTFRRPKDHDHPYSVISNEMLEDPALSFKAKGLMSYLLSRSDDWDTYQAQLANLGPDGRTATRSAMDELMDAGYLDRRTLRDEDGTFDGYLYLIYENGDAPTEPESTGSESTGSESTGSESTGSGKPESGRPASTKYGNNQVRKEHQVRKEGGSGSSARGRANPMMPDDLLPMYEVYEPEINDILSSTPKEKADAVVMNQWSQAGVSSATTRLVDEYGWPLFVSGVVITASEANNPNPRYLNTLLTALTELDEHVSDNPSKHEQKSNLERLKEVARTA